jgi:hypothetical protein
VDYATFAKLDVVTGNILWEKRLDIQSEFKDFDYNPSTNELIVVGNTLPTPPPGATFDNESIITRWSTSGTILGSKVYDQNGREFFERVVVHKNPVDASRSIYVLGRKNEDSASQPNGFDLPVVYNFNNTLTPVWIREYPEVSNVELEGYRGLEELSDGNLVLVGNGSIANEGLVIKVSGNDLSYITSYYHPGVIDWYDAMELPNGNILLAGTDFGSNRALLITVDPNFNHLTGIEFLDVSTFRNVWMDNNGDLYAAANEKAAPNRSIVHKLGFDPVTNAFNPLWAKYADDGETAYKDARIFVGSQYDVLYFADSRKDHPDGFGDFDLLIAAFDLEMTCACVFPFTTNSLGFTVNRTAVACNDPQKMEPPITPAIAIDDFNNCEEFCNPIDCDFTFVVNCFDVTFSGTATGMTPPLTFSWDVNNCDGIPDISGQNPTWTYPSVPSPGTYLVCMTVFDAVGNQCDVQKQVTVEDILPPDPQCPGDITLNTDPGQCYATFAIPDPIDDCDPNPIKTCQLSGATIGNGSTTQFEKGVTIVDCIVQDASGNTNTCNFTVTVVDNEDPVITCPANITVAVPGCQGAAEVFFPAPTVSDNCPMVSYVCSHQPGDIFPCGVTTVTCTATDMAGNTSTCTFTIEVICQCAEFVSSSMQCNPQNDLVQEFTIVLNSLAGLPNPGQSCTATVFPLQGGVSVASSLVSTWNGQQLTLTGAVLLSCPTPPILVLRVNLNCICPDGSVVNCDIDVFLEPQCCRTISIDDTDVCRVGPNVSIPLLNCPSLCDVLQIRWYVADAPCPPASWGPPFKVTTGGCQDLLLDPRFHSTDICVYAEVILGPGDGPCEGVTLVSDPATIRICDPVSCELSPEMQELCYLGPGSSVTPAPITATIMPAMPVCPVSLQWYDESGPIAGANQPTLQPSPLTLPAGFTECYKDFVYTLKIDNGPCGISECEAIVRVYNEGAPFGNLDIFPPEPLPLCPGEDLTLRYKFECAGDPPMWDWLISNDGVNFNPITTAGNQNPLYNTNRLYQDTWYRIEKANGVCPVDRMDLFIPVLPTIAITSFTADPITVCDPTAVELELDFLPGSPPSPCDYTITWYRNGFPINTTVVSSGPVTYTYSPTDPADVPGNYYAVISSNCCDESIQSSVVVIDPPCDVVIDGPCFRCNDEIVTLTGIIINPMAGVNCTYQWYDVLGPIPGAVGPVLTVQPNQYGPFTLEVTCNINGVICVKSDIFYLLQCGTSDPPTSPCSISILEFIDPIPDGLYQADLEIIASAPLANGGSADVTFKAGELISLLPGFETTLGDEFLAMIEECIPALPAGKDEGEDETTEDVFSQLEQQLLLQVRPNPFMATANVQFNLPEDMSSAEIGLFDLRGKQLLQVLPRQALSGGAYEVQIDRSSLPAGLYFIRLQADGRQAVKKVMVVD